MKTYRVVKDNYAGYEAQIKYDWLPFMWFQLNDFHWINTWQTLEQAEEFVRLKKKGLKKNVIETPDSEYELAKESKLLVFSPKNFSPEVVWKEKAMPEENAENRRRWWPAMNTLKMDNSLLKNQ